MKPTLSKIRARLASRIAVDWPRAKQLTLDAWKRSAPAREWISHHPNLVIAPAIVVAILFLLIAGQIAVAATLIGAWFALARGISQAAADFRRRINETYSRAVSQLASDKLEERLGGIYTLENISKESSDDYWTVMENLTAFVRERTQRTAANPEQRRTQRIAGRAHGLWEQAGRPDGRDKEFWEEAEKQEPPEADIAAVLTVIKRRSEAHRAIEARDEKVLDFREAFLRSAVLREAHLEGANLYEAHLERAFLYAAHLAGAHLGGAHLERAYLFAAHLEGASLRAAHLEHAFLPEAHLEGADLQEAHLERANLSQTHLEGADLRAAHLEDAFLPGAHLERANLRWAYLESADLPEAHLEDADLTGAHLERANLSQTHLEGANLSGAHLEGANLSGAHLEGASGLTQAQIEMALGDAATQLPEGLTRPARWTAAPGAG